MATITLKVLEPNSNVGTMIQLNPNKLTTGYGYLAHILLFIMKNRIKNLVRKVLIVLAVKGLLSPWFREIPQCWQIVCRLCTSQPHARTWAESF